MSTNFYISTIGPVTCEHCGHTSQGDMVQFHLGTRSFGWPFLRHASPEWPRDEAFQRWVSAMEIAVADGGQIVDEYWRAYTVAEMVTLADKCDQRAQIHDLFDGQWVDADGRRWDASEFS